MNTLLTPENAANNIGRQISFTYNKTATIRTLLRVSETGKTIYVDHQETKNCLQLVTRKIYILEKEKEKEKEKEIEKEEMIFPVINNIVSYFTDCEEDGESYFMCTGTCKRVCHYEDTDADGMCGTCQYQLSLPKRKVIKK
jgi:hypothetical protein